MPKRNNPREVLGDSINEHVRFGVRVRAGVYGTHFWALTCPGSSPFLTGKELGDAVTYVLLSAGPASHTDSIPIGMRRGLTESFVYDSRTSRGAVRV